LHPYVLRLGKDAVSTLPAECFNYASKQMQKDRALQLLNITTFCTKLNDNDGPFQCLQYASSEKLLRVSKAMEICASAVGGNNAAIDCMKDMKPYIKAQALRTEDIVSFCVASIPETYAYRKYFEENERLAVSPAAQCFKTGSFLLMTITILNLSF